MWLETFNQMRKESGMSLDELSAKSGVPKGTLSKITAGITKAPSLETIKSLVYAMGYTLKDLDDGMETSGCLSKLEKAHIQKYRLLSPEWKEAVDDVLSIGYRIYEERQAALEAQARRQAAQAGRSETESAAKPAPGMVEKLVYLNPAAAGTPLYAESDFERLEFPEDQAPKNADFGIRISGKSMEPTVRDGAIVWVRKTLELPNGAVGVFMINDSAVCKRFFDDGGTIRLESDNPAFGPVQLRESDHFKLVGEVVGAVDKR